MVIVKIEKKNPLTKKNRYLSNFRGKKKVALDHHRTQVINYYFRLSQFLTYCLPIKTHISNQAPPRASQWTEKLLRQNWD